MAHEEVTAAISIRKAEGKPVHHREFVDWVFEWKDFVASSQPRAIQDNMAARKSRIEPRCFVRSAAERRAGKIELSTCWLGVRCPQTTGAEARHGCGKRELGCPADIQLDVTSLR